MVDGASVTEFEEEAMDAMLPDDEEPEEDDVEDEDGGEE